MNSNQRLLFGVALVAALFAAAATDVEARGGRGRGGRDRERRKYHFRSQRAPERSKTPALDGNGQSDSGAAPVAGAALEGGFRKEVVDGGALLAMSSSRALVLNAYRGLALVDTSDPLTPVVLASVEVEGSGRRMFLGENEVVVVSDTYGVDGTSTIITLVIIGDSSLSVAGSVETDGSLVDAAREGDDLLLVTSDGYYGPYMYMDAMPGGPETGGPAANTLKRSRRPQAGRPGRGSRRDALVAGRPNYFGEAGSHATRVRIGSNGAPSILGVVAVEGSVVGSVLTGDDAVLAVQSSGSGYGYYGPLAGANDMAKTYEWVPPTISLVLLADDAQGAPKAAATLELADITGVSAIDRKDSTLRLLGWSDSGQTLAMFALSDAAITAEDSIVLGEWPNVFAFSGGAFIYGTTDWNYEELPKDPVFDPNEVKDAFGDRGMTNGAATGVVSGPSSVVHVVDLGDPAKLVTGGTLDMGAGWLSSFTKVDGGVVGTRYAYNDSNGSTNVFRVDASDPAAPSLAGSADLTGYASPGAVLGDLLFIDGGAADSKGSFRPVTQLVDLASGGLELGGSFSVGSWTSAAARSGDLVGLASYDRLTLVNVGDAANPEVLGEVRLVVNVAGFTTLSATTGAALTTDYLGGDVEIRTVALPAADALAPLDVLRVATGDAQMFVAAPFLYVVATDWSTGRASVHVVDATDPSNLALRGSLDLASYPGQVFLKGNALLLLRESYTLFDSTESGKLTAAPDAFGACPKSWLRDDLSSVLDVVDLRDPDAPAAAGRLRMRWDYAGQATLSGNSIYVPAYVALTQPDGSYDDYAYQIREIDVTNPLLPAARRAVDVPGTLVAATGRAHQVITADYTYDYDTGASSSTLYLVDLSLGWQDRVLASHDLGAYPESVTVGGDHVYAVTQSWNEQGSSAALATLDLSSLDEEASVSRDRGAWSGEIEGGCLFLRTWGWTGAIDVYSLTSPAAPSFLGTHDVAGWAGDISLAAGRAYVPAGMYGVQSFDLSK